MTLYPTFKKRKKKKKRKEKKKNRDIRVEIYHNVQRHSGGCRHRLSPSIERRMKRFCQTALKNFLPRQSRVTQQISLFQILIEFNYSIISNFHNNVVYDPPLNFILPSFRRSFSRVWKWGRGEEGEARIGNRCGSAKQYVKFERTKRMETRAQTLNGGSHAG